MREHEAALLWATEEELRAHAQWLLSRLLEVAGQARAPVVVSVCDEEQTVDEPWRCLRPAGTMH